MNKMKILVTFANVWKMDTGNSGMTLNYFMFGENGELMNPEQNLSGSYIGQDKAASIALSYVSGATQANVRSVKLDWDDGRAEYEVKIIYGTTEYEFEINAYTGAVLSRDMESIYD